MSDRTAVVRPLLLLAALVMTAYFGDWTQNRLDFLRWKETQGNQPPTDAAAKSGLTAYYAGLLKLDMARGSNSNNGTPNPFASTDNSRASSRDASSSRGKNRSANPIFEDVTNAGAKSKGKDEDARTGDRSKSTSLFEDSKTSTESLSPFYD
jgi:hypothetical protein